jgi:Dual specificity phosphatase, catalytic domain
VSEAHEPWPRGRSRHGGVDRIPLPVGVPGALWLAGKRYVAPDPDAALASVEGQTVVCLCERFELDGYWPEYIEWLSSPDAHSLWRPVHDFGVPPVEAMRALVSEIGRRLDAGEGVLVHCGAGIGRSGTVAVAVLMHYGVDRPTALDIVRTARPGAGPEVGAQTELLEKL